MTLPLLGPSFETMDCARFLLHVTSLRKVPKPRQKPKQTSKLNGRWLERPTRKRFGEYQLEYNEKLFTIPAPKDMTVTPEILDEACEALGCQREPLEALVRARKFTIRKLDTLGGDL